MPKNYILLIIIAATLSVSTPARTSQPNHSVKPENASIEKVAIKLVDLDEKRIEKFESLALLQLHSILMNSYQDLARQNTIIDWNSAHALYLLMASETRKFYLAETEKQKFTPKHLNPDLSGYFDWSTTNLQRRAALCEEIGRQKINPYLNEYLFSRIAKNINTGRVPVRPEDVPIFNLYMGKIAQIDRSMEEAVVPLVASLQRQYSFNFESLASPNFPFRLPLQEYPSESDYLYEAFIKDSGLPNYLEGYYKLGIEQFMSGLLYEFGFNAGEIASLWGSLFVVRKLGQNEVNLIGAASYLSDMFINCAKMEMEKRRKEFYEEAVDLNKAVLMKLRTNRQKLTILKQFISNTEKSLSTIRINNERAARLNGLKNKLEDYLKERDKLETFAQRQLNGAENLFLKYLAGDQNLIQLKWPTNSDLFNDKLLKFLVSKNRNLKDVIKLDPCEVFSELQKYFNKLAADTLRTKSEAGSQYITEQGARIENPRAGGASSPNPSQPPIRQTPIPTPPREMRRTWVGGWSGEGYHYDLIMTLTITDNMVTGSIIWKLRSSPRSEPQEKMGAQAIEYIRGTYDKENSYFSLEGYQKDDPHTIIDLDKYQLFLSPDGNRLSGKTATRGTWSGRLDATAK